MNADQIIKDFDTIIKMNDSSKALDFMNMKIAEAKEEGDEATLLVLYNEAMGYSREIGDANASYEYIDKAIAQCEKMRLIGEIPYATTMQNAANALRAGGRLSDSAEYYELALECYKEKIDSSDMLYASLYNNLSLLKQELGDFSASKEYLQKALNVVKRNENTFYEEAVTYANLSNSCAMLNEVEESKVYARTAVALFKQHDIKDSHYAAALTGLGNCAMKQENYLEAADYYKEAAACIQETLGETPAYKRVIKCLREAKKMQKKNPVRGMELCRQYYKQYGEPILKTRFAKYYDDITVGLCGEGSDCFGFDDEASRDHDWGPGFCVFVSRSLYNKIGRQLVEFYESLPKEYLGYKRVETAKAKGRVGILITEDFYKGILGRSFTIEDDEDMRVALHDVYVKSEDYDLAACVNGEIFHEGSGKFMKIRNKLKKGYPLDVRLLKIAQASALFSQGAQYNYSRMRSRGDLIASNLALFDGIRNALKLMYYIENKYPLPDKWLQQGISKCITSSNRAACEQIVVNLEKIIYASRNDKSDLDAAILIQKVGEMLAQLLYDKGFISDKDPYLDIHTDELVVLSDYSFMKKEDLCEKIAQEEFDVFNDVINEGGRAGCQDDWHTFRIMRISQYMTWSIPMLIRYRFDFEKATSMGRNLIAEKYARMEESTVPDKYDELKDKLPLVTEDQRKLVNSIVEIQVGFMEECAANHPNVRERSRSIRSSEDTPYNTSYETYLRGELLTYSDSMLMLYGRYVLEYAKSGRNIAEEIMDNTAVMYGYKSINMI